MTELAGEVAVVTGAARGIGRKVAERLAERGASVAILDLDGEAARKAASDLETLGAKSIGLDVDVTDEAGVAGAFAEVASKFGTVSILVNNAGIYPHIPLEELDLNRFKRVMSVNIDSVFLCTRTVMAGMKARGYGRIVNISSEVFFSGLVKVSAYAAAKGAVVGFTRVAASELGAHGITCNAIAPGLIETPGVMADIAGHFDEVLPYQAIKRRGQPEDIAEAILFLLSKEAGFITGQTISVNGGNSYR